MVRFPIECRGHQHESPTIDSFLPPWRAIIPDARKAGDVRLRQSLRAGRHETSCRCDRPTEQHWRASAFAAPLMSRVLRPFVGDEIVGSAGTVERSESDRLLVEMVLKQAVGAAGSKFAKLS